MLGIGFQKGEFWWKMDFKKLNFGKPGFEKSEFFGKLNFEKVNSREIWISKKWIQGKIELHKDKFKGKLDFKNVNFCNSGFQKGQFWNLICQFSLF